MAGVLSRRKTKALVSARLASLGHGEDFITPDALDALCARAGHGPESLTAALGAVLFLAATEDAPRVESRHVEQAVPLYDGPLPAAQPGWQAWQIVAAGACGAAAGALIVLWVVQRQAVVPVRVPTAPPKPQAASAPPVIFALPERRVVAPPPPVVLPVAPPLRVSLLVPAGDRETGGRFATVAARLRDAGIGDVQVESFNSRKIDARPWRHHVVYYFRQDLPLAQSLAAALVSAEDSSPLRNPWVPILVSATAGSTSHPPGSMDVFAP